MRLLITTRLVSFAKGENRLFRGAVCNCLQLSAFLAENVVTASIIIDNSSSAGGSLKNVNIIAEYGALFSDTYIKKCADCGTVGGKMVSRK